MRRKLPAADYTGMLLLFITAILVQCPHPSAFEEISRSMNDAQRVRNEGQLAAAQMQRLQTETKLIEEQTRLLRQQKTESPKADAALRSQPLAWGAAVEQAVVVLTKLYPDFPRYQEETARIAGMVQASDATVEQYLEILYLAAKFAHFSGSPLARSEVISQLAAGDATRELSDPVFRAASKIPVIR